MLAAVLGPALNLAIFTGAAGPVRVRPSLTAAVPAAGIVVLGLAVVSVPERGVPAPQCRGHAPPGRAGMSGKNDEETGSHASTR